MVQWNKTVNLRISSFVWIEGRAIDPGNTACERTVWFGGYFHDTKVFHFTALELIHTHRTGKTNTLKRESERFKEFQADQETPVLCSPSLICRSHTIGITCILLKI